MEHDELETNTDSTRALASIQVVDAITPHPNANALQLASVLGWQVVIRTDEVCVGDHIVYCEIDSLLPGEADWLPDAIKKRVAEQSDKKWFRTKTIKLRGEISQGLIVAAPTHFPATIAVGTNVTELLGIGKYEPNKKNGGNGGGGTTVSTFPVHIVHKTDEPRIQSHPKLLQALQGRRHSITIKCDGTSATYVLDHDTGEFLVCSRNQIRREPRVDDATTDVYWNMARRYDIKRKLQEVCPHVAIQGEICGPNIQKNLLGLRECDFFVFNIIDTKTKTRLPFDEMTKLCGVLGLCIVPILVADGANFNFSVKELLALSRGKYAGTKNDREGIVVRSADGVPPHVSFKVINNDYLLKNDY